MQISHQMVWFPSDLSSAQKVIRQSVAVGPRTKVCGPTATDVSLMTFCEMGEDAKNQPS